MTEREMKRYDRRVLRQGAYIPGTELYLHNYPTWIVDENGEVRKGVVHLSNQREFYVTLDFRVVEKHELHKTKAAAMRAAKAMKGSAKKK